MVKKTAVYGTFRTHEPVRQRYWIRRRDGVRQRYWKTTKAAEAGGQEGAIRVSRPGPRPLQSGGDVEAARSECARIYDGYKKKRGLKRGKLVGAC